MGARVGDGEERNCEGVILNRMQKFRDDSLSRAISNPYSLPRDVRIDVGQVSPACAPEAAL